MSFSEIWEKYQKEGGLLVSIVKAREKLQEELGANYSVIDGRMSYDTPTHNQVFLFTAIHAGVSFQQTCTVKPNEDINSAIKALASTIIAARGA